MRKKSIDPVPAWLLVELTIGDPTSDTWKLRLSLRTLLKFKLIGLKFFTCP